jgi:hypothetical protein
VFVTTGADPAILGNLLGQWCAIDSLVQIAELSCLGFPNLAVTRGLTAERMGNLVQQYLLNNVHVSGIDQVPGDGDALL